VSKVGGVGVQVGCRWFWGFDGVRDVEGGCAVVFDGVWGIDGGWGAVFDGVRGVEGGWNADLGAVGLLGVGSGVSTAFAWRFDGFCVLTWHGCGWRRRRGVVCVDFAAIDSHGAVTWQVVRWWVVVRWWEMAQGAGGAYLAVLGVETTVTWHHKRATRGG